MIVIMIITLFSLLFIGVGISTFVGRRLSKRLLKPIGTMAKNANNIQLSGVSSERLSLSGKKDEVNDLGETINEMLDRIESYSSAQTRFVSDASHELRTPITVILSYAEMLKKWAKDDKDALEKSIDSIEKEALNMKALIERLLLLAKSDSNRLAINNQPFEVCEFIAEIFEETAFVAGERKVELISNDKLILNSDRHRLKELLRVILDNAVKYTSENGRIKISSTAADKELKIVICDDGIGIKEEDLSKIFDRFFCAETSRNKKKSGNGLGLSIAKALADELGFQLNAESREGQYTKFILTKAL